MSELSGAKELNNFRIFGGYQKGGEKIAGICWKLCIALVRIRDIAAPKALERKKKRARDRERKEDVKQRTDC